MKKFHSRSESKAQRSRQGLRIFLLTAVFFISAIFLMHAQTPAAVPIALESGIPFTETLSNGLDIILLPQQGADKTGFSLIFRGGTDVQTTKTAGFFKLLEHLIFRGVATSPGEPEPAGVLEALSAQELQGGVQQERFFFSFTTHPEQATQALDTMLYLFSGLRMESAFADPKALSEAKDMSLLFINQEFSDPAAIYENSIARKIFISAPWRFDIGGPDYIINSVTEDILKEHARTWLIPNNACLVVTGNFNPEAIRQEISKRFSTWTTGPNPLAKPLAVFPKPGITRPTFMVLPDPSIPEGKTLIEMRYRGPDVSSSRYQSALLWSVMADDPDGRLQKAIKKGLPASANPQNLSTRYIPAPNASWLSISAEIAITAKSNLLDTILSFKELVRSTEMYAMKTNAAYFSASEYEKTKSIVKEQRMAAFSDPAEALRELSGYWILGGLSFIRDMPNRIEKVTSKDIMAFADEYFMKNLEVLAVRLSPEDYTKQKKSFDNYGFEQMTAQKAFWWR